MTLKEIVDNLGFGQECTYKDYSIEQAFIRRNMVT